MDGIMPCLGFLGRVWVTLALAVISTNSSFGDGLAGRTDTSIQKLSIPETGIASYYGEKYHGRQTASGEVFNMNELTAAHPKLAFGTRVRVTHLANDLSVIVRINDRGPFVKGRVVDLSQAAAKELQMVQSGLAEVRLEIIE